MAPKRQIDSLLAEATLKKELKENGRIHKDSFVHLVYERMRSRLNDLGVEVENDGN